MILTSLIRKLSRDVGGEVVVDANKFSKDSCTEIVYKYQQGFVYSTRFPEGLGVTPPFKDWVCPHFFLTQRFRPNSVFDSSLNNLYNKFQHTHFLCCNICKPKSCNFRFLKDGYGSVISFFKWLQVE